MARYKLKLDIRLFATLVIVTGVSVGGILFSKLPDNWVIGDTKDYSSDAPKNLSFKMDPDFEEPAFAVISPEKLVMAQLDPTAHVEQRKMLLIQRLFSDAAQLLKVGHHQQAITKLHQVLNEKPDLPEAHVNLGFALLGLNDLEKSELSFNHAIKLRATQANAYYGLALVAEKREDYHYAMGAMRSYLHTRKDDQYMAKARSAMQYWQNQLKVNSWQEPSDASSLSDKPVISSTTEQ